MVIKGAIPPIYPNVKRGSVGTPASSRAALAVGAVHVDDDQLAPYSSHGPTDDGRLKPEVSAPSKTTSRSYGEGSGVGPFAGTSAACPHVSGFAALLKQQSPGSSVEELRSAVMHHVRPRGASPPNNQFGHGHIDGSRVPGAGSEPEPPPEPPGASPEGPTDFLDPIMDILDAEEEGGRR
jgi:subtilisin family serine protease